MAQLKEKITLYGLTMIAVGSCIGSGIFVTPYKVVEAVPHPSLILLVWTLGGLIALTGALTFAELGSLFPKVGGVYVFLKEAYGELVGFLYGWVILLVINTGALAALSIALAEYMTFFFPLTYFGKILLAIGVILVLTTINILGVHISQIFANVFTGLKLLAILGVVIIAFLFYEPSTVELQWSLSENIPDDLAGQLLIALIGVLWSFGGWHHASYIAGETKNAKVTVPLAMIFGAIIVTITYVLVNLAYMLLLPLETIAQTTRVAGDAVASVIPYGGQIMAIAIAMSIFGTIGIYTMTAPRIYFAMAKDGIFFKQLTYIHPKFHTPSTAMIIQALWAVVLLLFWGSFHNLITYVTFMDIVFMTMAGASIFIFRRTKPDREEGYRTLGYPVVPLIFVGISAAFVFNTLLLRPVQALAGIVLVVIGAGFYFVFKRT